MFHAQIKATNSKRKDHYKIMQITKKATSVVVPKSACSSFYEMSCEMSAS